MRDSHTLGRAMDFLLAYEASSSASSSVATVFNLEVDLIVLGTTSTKRPIAVRKAAPKPNKT